MRSKAITYERLMNAIYNELGKDKGNAIETDENERRMRAYIKKYMEAVFGANIDLYNDMYCDFLDVVCEYCRSGFNAGFESAVTLFVARGGADI